MGEFQQCGLHPLVNPMISPKPISGIVEARIVTNHGELLDYDKDYSTRKHKSFLLENRTMTEKEDHPWLEMLVKYLLVDKLYQLIMAMVDPSVELVMGLQEVDL